MGQMVMSITRHQRRTQAERRDAARGAMIETAIQLLADGGYGSMTLADLGERSGYSRSLATHYFGSKPKLLAAIVDHVLGESPPTVVDHDLRGLERIEAGIAALFDGLTINPSWARAYIVIAHEAATSTPELRPAIHQQNTVFRGRIDSAIREGIDRGTIHPDLDPASASIAVMAMLRGITWEWFTDATLDLTICKQAILTQARVLLTAAPGGA